MNDKLNAGDVVEQADAKAPLVERLVMCFAKAGVFVMAAMFYLAMFWGMPLTGFIGTQERPEAMGCTFLELVTMLHLMIACIIWASWGMAKLTNSDT